MPNAIELLTADHVHVKELFQQYEAAGHRAYQKKQRIAEEVFAALEAHTTLEEELFYPAISGTWIKTARTSLPRLWKSTMS